MALPVNYFASNRQEALDEVQRLRQGFVPLIGPRVRFGRFGHLPQDWLEVAKKYAQPDAVKTIEFRENGELHQIHLLDKNKAGHLSVYSAEELAGLAAISPEPVPIQRLGSVLYAHRLATKPDLGVGTVIKNVYRLNLKATSNGREPGLPPVLASVNVGGVKTVYGVQFEVATRLNLPLVKSIEPLLHERYAKLVGFVRTNPYSSVSDVLASLGLPNTNYWHFRAMAHVATINRVSRFFHGRPLIEVGKKGFAGKSSLIHLSIAPAAKQKPGEPEPAAGNGEKASAEPQGFAQEKLRRYFRPIEIAYLNAIDASPEPTTASVAKKLGVKMNSVTDFILTLARRRIPGHEGPIVLVGGQQSGGANLILSPTFAKMFGFKEHPDPAALLIPRSRRFLYRPGAGVESQTRPIGVSKKTFNSFLGHLARARQALFPHLPVLKGVAPRVKTGKSTRLPKTQLPYVDLLSQWIDSGLSAGELHSNFLAQSAKAAREKIGRGERYSPRDHAALADGFFQAARSLARAQARKSRELAQKPEGGAERDSQLPDRIASLDAFRKRIKPPRLADAPEPRPARE